MPFKTILTQVVEAVPGASGAILADWEGESVEQYCHYDPFELKVTAAHAGIILSNLKEALVSSHVGLLKDAVLTTKTQYIIIGAIGPDYTMVMTLNRCALLGPALHKFRIAIQKMHEEIY